MWHAGSVKTTIIAIALGCAVLSGCAASVPAVPAASGSAGATTTVTAPATGDTHCTYTPAAQGVKKVELPPSSPVADSGTLSYVLTMNGKPLGLTLFAGKTPCTVNSFVSLASQGFFDGSSCHRLVDSGIYVLQCGDPSGTGSGGPGYSFGDELTGKETYGAGTLAMANAGANTNGSQFFIVYADSQLSAAYTVFGTVDAAGLKVVAAIAAGGQDGRFGSSGGGKPKLPAVIDTVKPA